MKNHIIPKLILKRFSKSINIYNFRTKELIINKNISKTFVEKDKYTDEIEDNLNVNIESRFANLLDAKILNENNIEINRTELYLIKKYYLTMSIRSLEPDYFFEIIKTFEERSKLYEMYNSNFPKLPKIQELDISSIDFYERTLEVFSRTDNIRDIYVDPLATQEMIAWAFPFLESYISFWDAPLGSEFVITDNAMTSEYEGFHMITNGLSLSKKSYLLDKVKTESELLTSLLVTESSMYENYNIFVLSSNRVMVMINPFFSLYDDNFGALKKDGSLKKFNKPDIWPAIIQDRNLFVRPSVKYEVSDLLSSRNDRFLYSPKDLNSNDLIYINFLLLSQSNSQIGFDKKENIIESISFYKRFYQEINIDEKSIFDKYFDFDIDIRKDYENIFNEIIKNIYLDFNTNPYIIRYLLDNNKKTIMSKHLSFLGKGNLRIYNLKNKLINMNKNIWYNYTT